MTTKPDQVATAEQDYSDFAPLSDREIEQLFREQDARELIRNTTDFPNPGFNLPANETEQPIDEEEHAHA